MALINTKLLKILRSFTKDELKEFRKFISTGYYSRGRNYLPVINNLMKLDDEGIKKITSRELYDKIYPEKKYNKQTLKNRFTELNRLTEDYLIITGLREDTFLSEKLLLKKLLEKKLYSNFENKHREVFSELDKANNNTENSAKKNYLTDLWEIYLKEKNK